MDANTAVTIGDWLTNPAYRNVVIVTALVFTPIGFAVGCFFSRPGWEFVRWYLERSDSRKQQERYERERASLRLKYGVYWGADNFPVCPICMQKINRFTEFPNCYPSTKCQRCKETFVVKDANLVSINRDFPNLDV